MRRNGEREEGVDGRREDGGREERERMKGKIYSSFSSISLLLYCLYFPPFLLSPFLLP
jgi:hypothetical protein